MNEQVQDNQPGIPQSSGFIIIQLIGGLATPNDETLQEFARRQKLEGLEAVLRKWNQPGTRRAIWSLPASQILELERRATKNRSKKRARYQIAESPLPTLTRYWRLDARKLGEGADGLLRDLSNLKEVDFAYKELEASDPALVTPSNDGFSGKQGYLKPASEGGGIDALFAWQFTNGAGVGFVDLEQGWYPAHKDLNLISPVLFGYNWVDDDDHGTSVLGIVVGNDNNIGVVGIAPGVSSVKLTSRYDAATASNSDVGNALAAVTPYLTPGDVVLLEVQKDVRPTEIELLDYVAIRLATDSDIIVVEAAGNHGDNLDNVSVTEKINGQSRIRSLDRRSPNFRDSGAIMVGACHKERSNGQFRRLDRIRTKSNYGTRIDCYAWGEGIVTTSTTNSELGPSPDDPKSKYTNSFGGTSGAAAIVAGAALLLQSRYQEKKGGARLLNFEGPLKDMRTILSTHGASSPDPIGKMPDLKAIFTNPGLNLTDAA